MKIIFQLFTKYSGIIVVLLIAALAVFDLSHYGIPPTHDGEYHIMRFWQFDKNIKDGVFYPRWAPDFDNGYGVPLFNYVYPLPNYSAVLFSFLGFGLIESLKLNFAVATFFGAVFFYLWAKKYWGEWGGVVSSVYYTFSPYHFLDIYVRGSVGEVWSLAIFPTLLWSYKCWVETNERKHILLSSVFLSLLILAHNILAVIFFSFFLLYALFELYRKKKHGGFINLLFIILFGLGMSSIFWLPAILETKYVSGLQIFDPTDHFPKLYQLIYSSWGYGFSGTSTVGNEGQMSFQIGIANLIAIFLSLLISYKTRNKIIIFFFVIFIFSVFLITPFSQILWEKIPFVSYIQFPWRLLSVVIVATSFLAGSIVSKKIIKGKNAQILLSFILIFLALIFSIRYAKAPFYHEREDSHYLTRSNFTDGTNSPGDMFNTRWLKAVPEKRELAINNGSIENIQNKTNEKMYIISTQKDQVFYPNISYFPGWKAFINNKEVKIINKNGLIGINIVKGKSVVKLKLQNTSIQLASLFIFCVSFFSLLLFVFYPAIIKKW